MQASRSLIKVIPLVLVLGLSFTAIGHGQLIDPAGRDAKRKAEIEETQKKFSWWPTDAKPGPFKDERGGYWWWPNKSGTVKTLWGNRGYVYVYKLIYDYKEKDTAASQEPTPAAKVVTKSSLLIKKIVKNVKIYFDYNKAALREDHNPILESAVKALKKDPSTSILITGNCDARGSDEYNMKLGKKRGIAVQTYMLDNGIPEERIKIVSRGKLDAIAPVHDIVGMEKDRNAQFMIAEVDEVEIPANQVPPRGENLKVVDNGKYEVEEKENVESGTKASTKEYTVKEGDNLWKIAREQMGNAKRWEYLYDLNKDRIKNKNKLKKGTVLIIPVE